MTIDFIGRIENIRVAALDKVELTLYAQSSVCVIDPIIIHVTKAEAEVYRAGMQVKFEIRSSYIYPSSQDKASKEGGK